MDKNYRAIAILKKINLLSYLLCFQFENEQALAAAEPDLLKWQKRLSAAMLKKGVVLKDMRKHLVFTLEAPDS